MKKSEFKAQIREEIIDILEAATQDDVKAQQDFNKELEKTAKLQKSMNMSEGNDSDKFQDDGYVQHKYDDDVIDKYNIPVEPTAVFEEDNYADYQDIGQAYLENMGRPHSLNDDQLENLGKQIVDRLYKGDIGKAYDEIVMYDPRKLKEEDEEYNADGNLVSKSSQKTKDRLAKRKSMADFEKAGREFKDIDDKEPKAGDLKGEPLSKIGYKLAATQEEMRKVVKKWSAMDEGSEKDKLYSRLKELNKIKKELEALL